MRLTLALSLAAATASLCAAALPAQAQTGRHAATGTSRTADAGRTTIAPNRRVCVVSQTTGSRINRTVCRTQAEWDAAGGY